MTEEKPTHILAYVTRHEESIYIHGSDDGPPEPEPIPLPKGFIELHLLNCAESFSVWHVAVESIAGYGPNFYRSAYKLDGNGLPAADAKFEYCKVSLHGQKKEDAVPVSESLREIARRCVEAQAMKSFHR